MSGDDDDNHEFDYLFEDEFDSLFDEEPASPDITQPSQSVSPAVHPLYFSSLSLPTLTPTSPEQIETPSASPLPVQSPAQESSDEGLPTTLDSPDSLELSVDALSPISNLFLFDQSPEPPLAYLAPPPVKPKRTNKPRKNWTDEETEVLLRAVEKHGAGNWSQMIKDETFNFNSRKAVDLKDRFRTCFPKDYKRHVEAKVTRDTTSCPLPLDLSYETSKQGKVEKKKVYLETRKLAKEARRAKGWSSIDEQNLVTGFYRYGGCWKSIRNDTKLDLRHFTQSEMQERCFGNTKTGQIGLISCEKPSVPSPTPSVPSLMSDQSPTTSNRSSISVIPSPGLLSSQLQSTSISANIFNPMIYPSIISGVRPSESSKKRKSLHETLGAEAEKPGKKRQKTNTQCENQPYTRDTNATASVATTGHHKWISTFSSSYPAKERNVSVTKAPPPPTSYRSNYGTPQHKMPLTYSMHPGQHLYPAYRNT